MQTTSEQTTSTESTELSIAEIKAEIAKQNAIDAEIVSKELDQTCIEIDAEIAPQLKAMRQAQSY